MTMTPSTYKPLAPDQFIGGARLAAQLLCKAVAHANAHGRQPLKFLVNGQPGIGKSALAGYLAHLLGADRWSITKYNGTQVKMEAVEKVAYDLQLTNLFSDWRLFHIDEADAIPTVAQVRLLTLLDDLPRGTAVFCTSNCKLTEFEPRFLSRFQPLFGPKSTSELDPPTGEEIRTLVRPFLPATLKDEHIANIWTFACGNVRQALLETESTLAAIAHPLPLAA